MDLLDNIRAMREAERLTTLQQPGFTDAMGLGTGVDIGGMMAAAAIEDQVSAAIGEAAGPDLLAAYQRTDGEPGNPEADALLAEIERRGLDI
ncbi:hypothetical protein [Sphingomonas rubra]|uniref:Uncharacterized protein n=1 Tax=Sphingomonas rubra TaxID=634430 RepID=A0A1I5UTF5_9SPHN|nr:hypothetical protein [Sphingomonas rubra]SFP98480.1 hypothetical protein SAMN04488241_1164 [Sphingomonas rubra]